MFESFPMFFSLFWADNLLFARSPPYIASMINNPLRLDTSRKYPRDAANRRPPPPAFCGAS